MRHGIWLAAGTPVCAPYPCRCAETSTWDHEHGRCPCWGRYDIATMARGCCGWKWQGLPVMLARAGA